MIDAIASERHFLAHLAPVWRALPDAVRGTFYVTNSLVEVAGSFGVEPVPVMFTPPEGGPILVAAYGDIKRARKAHRRAIAFLEHGAGQSYGGAPEGAAHHSYAGGTERDDVGLFLVPNEQAAWRWRAAYPGARVELVGSPATEELPAREPGPGPVVAVSFHWDPRDVSPEAESAIRDFAGVLPDVAGTFSVIGHGHPRRRDLEQRYKALGVEYVRDFREVCRRADVYVCDNSSTLFEFAATGRPVVALNARRYRRWIRHGLRFWDCAGVGPNVDRPGDLVAAIALALEDPPLLRAEREVALEHVYQPRRGGAGLAAQALAEWAA